MAKLAEIHDKKSCNGRGRPRCATSESKILEAAYGLLVEKGWEGFTIEGVANRAGASKATVYRWWTDRNRLAVDCFVAQECCEDGIPDTGCLFHDMHAQIMKVVDLLCSEQSKAVRGVFFAVQEQPELLEILETKWSPICPGKLEGLVDQAVLRGQMPAGTDSKMLFEMVFGSVLMKLMLGREIERSEVEPMVGHVLLSFGFKEEGSCPEPN